MTRAERRRRSIIALALSAGWIAAIMARLGFRADIGAINVAVPLVLWVVAAAVSMALAFRPRARGLPPASPIVQVIAAAIPMVFLASVLIASRDVEPAELTLRNTGACLVWASITAAGPFLLAGLLLQRSFLSAPVWRGTAIGVVCGLCAAACIHAHCPMAASAHVVLAHGFPIAAGGLFGAIFGALRGRA